MWKISTTNMRQKPQKVRFQADQANHDHILPVAGFLNLGVKKMKLS
jgi:hypothetical protein